MTFGTKIVFCIGTHNARLFFRYRFMDVKCLPIYTSLFHLKTAKTINAKLQMPRQLDVQKVSRKRRSRLAQGTLTVKLRVSFPDRELELSLAETRSVKQLMPYQTVIFRFLPILNCHAFVFDAFVQRCSGIG